MRRSLSEFITTERVPLNTAALSLAIGAIVIGLFVTRGASGRYINGVFTRVDDGLEGYMAFLLDDNNQSRTPNTGQDSADVLE